MITGYNTDVRHQETVLHVQTEDKGTGNPTIETLVYFGGRVLAAQRLSYAKLLENGKGEKEIVALMEHQHRKSIAAIRSGKLDEKLDEVRLSGSRAIPVVTGDSSTLVQAPPNRPTAELDGAARTLDQVILDYLTSEADQEQLVLMVDGESEISLGTYADLTIRTSSSKSGQPVARARVAVRMISTVSEPRTLISGETDESGVLRLAFRIPNLERGTAALIVVADSAIGTAEIKHLL
jgi:hypothetical protein